MFWPKVGYGISCIIEPLDQLEHVLKNQHYQMLPLDGVVRSAKTGIRQLDRGFFGAGLPSVGVEVTVQALNKLLMHYGTRSSVGLLMQTSMETLLLEVGMSFQPFDLDFGTYGCLATTSFLKSIWEKVDRFNFQLILNNIPLQFPRKKDQWLMNLFIRCGYKGKELQQLNRVRIHQQVVFLSCILTANGKAMHPRYKTIRRLEEQWSSLRFPNEDPTEEDFNLWLEALDQLAPGGWVMDRLKEFVAAPLIKQEWWLCEETNRVFYDGREGKTVFAQMEQVNRYCEVASSDERPTDALYCSVQWVEEGILMVSGRQRAWQSTYSPSNLWDVLDEWGHAWLWKNLCWTGDGSWLAEAIEQETLVAVTDGSFIKELFPDLCSAAFIFECKNGKGRLAGSFINYLPDANAYRGELLGLMAVHLILKAINVLNPSLTGSVDIYSDCLGALDRVEHLPPGRIPSKCQHSDILKNIMVNCSDLTFKRFFSHVAAHQDDHTEWRNLSRPAQLNSACDAGAKQAIYDTDAVPKKPKLFPLEPIALIVDQEKIHSGNGEVIRFAASRHRAKEFFAEYKLMSLAQFKEVDWRHVYRTLHEVPRLFQLWACKQVMRIAGTMNFLHYQDKRSPLCPCCCSAVETTHHILRCKEAGRMEAFDKTVELLVDWMEDNDTDPVLQDVVETFLLGRGHVSMEEICNQLHGRFRKLGRSQDKIGWEFFLLGMVSKECLLIQTEYATVTSARWSPQKWMSGFIVKLLEISHGQWIYRNTVVHDKVSGLWATHEKEELRFEIEKQQELGATGLLQEDQYLAEVNLDDLETTSGEDQAYWLVAIKAARKMYHLKERQRKRGRSQETGR